MESILQKTKECYFCKSTLGLHCHHIYFGSANRKVSEHNGFKVWLCYEHHEGTNGIHGINGHKLDQKLKQVCQRKYEKTHTRKEFMQLIGKNYLS